MKPVLGTPTGTGVAPTGAIATQTPTAKNVGKGGILLVLVDDDEATWVGQFLDAAHRLDAAEGGQHHRIGEWQLVGLARCTVVDELLHRHQAGGDVVDAGVGDPLDVLLPHLAFQETLGVPDAVETEMTDIRLRGDERHRDPVAQLSAAQLRLQDEEEFVGRPETGRALHGADDDRARVRRELLESLARMRGMIDVADRLGMALWAETRISSNASSGPVATTK